MKKLQSLILAILWSTGFALADSGGTTGDCTWYLDTSAKKLTISGSGAMADYTSSSLPSWCDYVYYIKNVVIDSSVTHIGAYAFYNCTNLTGVSMGESVESIGTCAFYNCENLTSIKLKSNLTKISGSAFSFCLLTTVYSYATIPPTCSGFHTSTYNGTLYAASTLYEYADIWKKFSTLTLMSGAEEIYTISGSCGDSLTYTLNVKNGTLIIDGTGDMYDSTDSLLWRQFTGIIKSVTISDGVTSLTANAFQNCTALTSIEIPSTVTSIGDYTFYGCTKLASVTFEDDSELTTIGNSAFYNCTALTSIEIPSTVTSIGDYTFYGCTKLASVTFEDDSELTTIGNRAFYNCTALTSIEIPESVTTIGNSAFYNCTALTSIEIPSSVTTIGNYTFYGCTKLASVTFEDDSELTTIGNYAFYNCTALTSIEFPSTTTSIGTYAFSGCTGLTSVTSYNLTPPTAYASTFSSTTYSSATLYAPSSDYETATCWTEFYTIIAIPIITVDEDGYTKAYGDDDIDFTKLVTYNPGEAEITITYIEIDSDGNETGTETTSQPSEIGSYKVTISVAETETSTSASAETTLTVTKATSLASLDNASEGYIITYGDNPVDIESDINNPANAEISIAYVDADGNSYSTQPTNAGEYDVAITIAETDNYEGDELTTTLTIEKAQPTLTISVDDIYEGETLNIDVETNSDGEQTQSFVDESGNETTDEPTAAGEYSVIVNIAESDNYLAASDTATFSIMTGNAISDIAAEASTIRTVGNTIVITSPARATAKVVSLSGIVIKEVIVYQGETQIEMAHDGIYIVLLSDGTKAKVLIK